MFLRELIVHTQKNVKKNQNVMISKKSPTELEKTNIMTTGWLHVGIL